jgi:hypothetical protein
MKKDILTTLTRLSDAELVGRLKSLAGRERHATALVVAHLAEMDTRDVHLRAGYSSLFAYCRDVLGYSEGEAGNRTEVARAARRFPVILEMLASGVVTLTAVRLLAPHLTAANHRAVLESAQGKRKEEVQKIAACLSPRPDVQTSIRKLPAAPPEVATTAPLLAQSQLASMAPPSTGAAPAVASPVLPPPTPSLPPPVTRAAVSPLSPDRYKLQLTITGDMIEKLRLAKDMLSHAIPSGDDAAVLDRALTALLGELAKKKFGDTPRPRRAQPAKPGPSDPPAAVKRAVWVRDLGRCTYTSPNGHRCNERRFVEFHHVDPRALGGQATVDQIRLLCRRHNNYEASLYFGKRTRGDGSQAVREQAQRYGSASLFQNMSDASAGAKPQARAQRVPTSPEPPKQLVGSPLERRAGRQFVCTRRRRRRSTRRSGPEVVVSGRTL